MVPEAFGTVVGVMVASFLATILIMLVVSEVIFYIMKKRHPERGYGQGGCDGGIPSIDSIWFD
jgi:hypothetical protein